MTTNSIVPCIWGEQDPQAMFEFYRDALPEVEHVSTSYYPTEGLLDFQKDMAGKILTLTFSVCGTAIMIVNGGSFFTPNPSVSFMVRFPGAAIGSGGSAAGESDPTLLAAVWEKLSSDGSVLMPLDSYPFSSQYGWAQDQFGVSWQLIADDSPTSESAEESGHDSDAVNVYAGTVSAQSSGGVVDVTSERPRVMPVLMFSGPAANRAEEAMTYYCEVFPDSAVGEVSRYPEPEGVATTDSLAYADCLLGGQWIGFMDSGTTDFTFSEGLSLIIDCNSQQEIDHFWERLSRVPESEQCGWCKDDFGVSWQVTPLDMDDLVASPRAYSAMMSMKKIDLEELRSLA